MAVGFPTKVNYATGDVLTATNMNDLSGTVNLLESAQYAAGKNKIINGDFGIWQRGTSFNATSAANVYSADRWTTYQNGSGTFTISQQAFTPGTAPVAGYEGSFFLRNAITTLGTTTAFLLSQRIEDVRTFAGQTVTVSFWSKSLTNLGTVVSIAQNFGSGGSSTVTTSGTAITNTGSWQRFTQTIVLPSIAGKTIGTSSYLELTFTSALTANQSIDIWGVQLEAGSTASPFQTATGTKQGELAACQRYYWRMQTGASLTRYTTSLGSSSTTDTYGAIANPVPMRLANPSAVDYANLRLQTPNTVGGINVTAIALQSSFGSQMASGVQVSVASGLTTNLWYALENATTGGYLGFSAEL